MVIAGETEETGFVSIVAGDETVAELARADAEAAIGLGKGDLTGGAIFDAGDVLRADNWSRVLTTIKGLVLNLLERE